MATVEKKPLNTGIVLNFSQWSYDVVKDEKNVERFDFFLLTLVHGAEDV